MKRLSELLISEKPYIHEVVGTIQNLQKLYEQFNYPSGLVSKTIQGQKCKNKEDLFKEVSEVLLFPSYFGWNWDAFDECLNDLEWLNGDSYVITICNADMVLKSSKSDFFYFSGHSK